MPKAVDRDGLLLFIDDVNDTVIAAAEPVSVFTFQFLRLRIGEGLILERKDCFVDLKKFGVGYDVELFFDGLLVRELINAGEPFFSGCTFRSPLLARPPCHGSL